MFDKIRLKYFLAVCLFLGASCFVYPAHSIQVITFHAIDTPLEITNVQFITATNDFSIAVKSRTDQVIKNVIFKGMIFNADNERAGGFLTNMNLELKPGETININTNFSEIVNSKDEASLKSLSTLLHDGNIMILLPKRVFYKAPLRLNSGDKSNSWMLDSNILTKLTPANINEFPGITGKNVAEIESVVPEQSCYFCDGCRSDAYSCGNVKIGTNCRSYACVISWYCDCDDWYCSFTCKPPDMCC